MLSQTNGPRLFVSERLSIVVAMLCTAAMLAACGGTLNTSSTRSGGGSSSSKDGDAGAFEGVLVQRSHIGSAQTPLDSTETYYMKGSHLRIEKMSNMGPLGQHKMIVLEDFDSGKITSMFPDKKQFMIMDLGDFAGAADTENGYSLTRTGQKETIAGHSCEDWHLTIKGEDVESVEMCIAKGLGNYMSGFAKFFNPKTRAKLEANPDWKGFFSGGMFPLKMRVTDAKGTPMSDSEVTSIEPKKLDDSLFIMPTGYTQMRSPAGPE